MDKIHSQPAAPAPAGVPARVRPAQPAPRTRTWQATVDGVRPYVVKVSTPSGHGTGFLFAQNTRLSLWGIATAAHVIRDEHAWEQPIRIEHLESGTKLMLYADKRGIFVSPQADAAAIVIKKGTIPFPNTFLSLIDPTMFKRVGVEAGWLGYPGLGTMTDQLCFFSGRISCWIGGQSTYLVDGVAIHGVSGGPAFDDDGELFGIVTSYIYSQVQGQALPGLLSVCDVAELQRVVQDLKDLEQAQQQQTPPAASAARAQAESKATGGESTS